MCRSRRIIFRVNSLSSYYVLVSEIKEVVRTVQQLLVSTKPFHLPKDRVQGLNPDLLTINSVYINLPSLC